MLAITKKYYFGSKGSIGINKGRWRRRMKRKKAVPRATMG